MDRLTELVQQSIQDEIAQAGADYFSDIGLVLDNVNKNRLAQKTLYLPSVYTTILFLKYSFFLNDSSISDILGRPHIAGCLKYIEHLLCYSMGISAHPGIHSKSVAAACRIALPRYISRGPGDLEEIVPDYSSRFRRELHMLKSAQKPKSMLRMVGRRIAVAALAAVISLAMALTVNAEFRARFFTWIHNTFSAFSEFGAAEQNLGQFNIEELRLYRAHYIPHGFTLYEEPYVSATEVVYEYQNALGDFIALTCCFPTGSLIGYDTEGITVEEFIYKGQPAYQWDKGGISFLVWQQDGYEFSLAGWVSQDEVKRMADSIFVDS